MKTVEGQRCHFYQVDQRLRGELDTLSSGQAESVGLDGRLDMLPYGLCGVVRQRLTGTDNSPGKPIAADDCGGVVDKRRRSDALSLPRSSVHFRIASQEMNGLKCVNFQVGRRRAVDSCHVVHRVPPMRCPLSCEAKSEYMFDPSVAAGLRPGAGGRW